MPLPTRLALPSIARKDATDALAAADDAEKRILRLQVLVGGLIRGDEDVTASAERIAWLALWTRAFSLLDAARGAIWQNSTLSLTLLERSALEAGLQLRTIVEPLLAEPPTADCSAEVVRRYRAFTAWALWNDRATYEGYLNPEVLERAYDAEPARRLASSDTVRSMFAAVFGEAEILNEHELETEKATAADRFRQVVSALTDMLDDPAIADWIRVLSKKRPRQFYELFDTAHSSVRARMKGSGHDYVYTVYRQQSQLAHGGTLEPFLLFKGSVVGPRLPTNSPDIERLAENVAAMVGTQVVDLGLSKGILWPAVAR